jgi:hypothetical protein
MIIFLVFLLWRDKNARKTWDVDMNDQIYLGDPIPTANDQTERGLHWIHAVQGV